MVAPPPAVPVDESQRLAALDRLDIFDTPPEAAFDRITQELARIFDVPLATIAFIDSCRQFYKSRVLPGGMDEVYPRSVPRESSICNVVVGRNASLVIDDLASDPSFASHPAVTEYGLRFYSGTPLRTDDGQPVGSLCIMDRRPRHLSDTEQALLTLLAQSVMTEVKLRAATRRLVTRNEQIERDLARARTMQQFLLPPAQVACGTHLISQLYHPHDHLGGDFLDILVRPDGSAVILVADVTGHGASAALLAAMTKTAFQRHAPALDHPGKLLGALNTDLYAASPSGQFMTALAAILRSDCRTLDLAIAGHPRPLRVRDGAAVILDVEGTIPLLIEPDLPYDHRTRVDLGAEDRFLFYTDGASEAMDSTGQTLDPAGLAQLAGGICNQGCGPDFLARLLERISSYAGHLLKDDIALVSIEPAT